MEQFICEIIAECDSFVFLYELTGFEKIFIILRICAE